MINSRSVNKSILNSISDYAMIMDRDYKVVFANNALIKLCQKTSESDIVGKDCYYVSQCYSLPCLKKVSSETCSHHEIFETGKTVHCIITHRLNDGSERIFDMTSSPVIDETGNVVQIIEILRDVTETKRAEEMLNKHNLLVSVFDSTEDGVVVIDRDFKILTANKSYLKQTGCSLEEVKGRHCYNVSHHIDKPCYLAGEECSVKNAFDTGTAHWIIHKHYDKNLKPVYVETVSYPLKDISGNIDSAVEIVRDISDKKEIEEILANRVQELEEFYDMAISRELKMIELKEEIEKLKKDKGK